MAGTQANNRIVDELLSSVAQGYSNGEYVADQIFPEVVVTKEAGKIRHFTKELFHYHNAQRALGAHSNVLNQGNQAPISWSLSEYDLAIPVDYREEAETTDINLERAKTYELSEMMKLRREKRVADAVQTQGNYTSNNTSAVGTKWNASGGDPIADVNAAKVVVRGNIGREPNTLLLGYTAFQAAKNSAAVIDRVKYSQKGVITTDILKELFEVDNLIVGKAVWIDPATGVQADVWGDNAILSYVSTAGRDQRSIRTPGFGYTLVKRGWPPIDTYFIEGGKVKMIRYTANEELLFHGQIAGYFLRDTNS
jgi:hypothetical protein